MFRMLIECAVVAGPSDGAPTYPVKGEGLFLLLAQAKVGHQPRAASYSEAAVTAQPASRHAPVPPLKTRRRGRN